MAFPLFRSPRSEADPDSKKCEQNTLTRHIFSCFTAHISMSHVTLAQVSCAHVIHVSSAWCCCLDTLRLSTLHSSPSNLHDLEIDDYTIGRALSSPLFTQEREDPASLRQAYHSPDESLLSSQSLYVGHVGTGRRVSDEFGSLFQT